MQWWISCHTRKYVRMYAYMIYSSRMEFSFWIRLLFNIHYYLTESKRIYAMVHLLPKQHSIWAPAGPQLGKVGPQMGPGWAWLGPIWECCLGFGYSTFLTKCYMSTLSFFIPLGYVIYVCDGVGDKLTIQWLIGWRPEIFRGQRPWPQIRENIVCDFSL